MAGFALNLAQVMKSDVQFGVNVNGKDSASGQLETDFLEHFTTKDTVECRGSNEEVRVLLLILIVWGGYNELIIIKRKLEERINLT